MLLIFVLSFFAMLSEVLCFLNQCLWLVLFPGPQKSAKCNIWSLKLVVKQIVVQITRLMDSSSQNHRCSLYLQMEFLTPVLIMLRLFSMQHLHSLARGMLWYERHILFAFFCFVFKKQNTFLHLFAILGSLVGHGLLMFNYFTKSLGIFLV